MPIKKHTSEFRKTIRWASGTSTEIFIFPPEGNFAERDFLFRISTATVETEASTFTVFGGITRHLMVLAGELLLIHEGRYQKILRPFEQDTFSGEWPTRSEGKVTDFNLMLKRGAVGTLKHHTIGSGQSMTFASKGSFYFIYVAAGSCNTGEEGFANAADLIQLEKNKELTLTAKETCEVIGIEVTLNSDDSTG